MTPKADLHVHSEGTRRLDQYLARRDPYDWAAWRREFESTVLPGFQRFTHVGTVNPVALADDDDECLIGRYVEVLPRPRPREPGTSKSGRA